MCGGIRGKYIVKCQTCGKEVEVYHSGLSRKYCSRACKRMPKDAIEKIRKTKTGMPIHSEEWKRIKGNEMLGNQYAKGFWMSPEHKQAIINAHTGSKSHFWKDGRCYNPVYITWQKGENGRRKRNAVGSHVFAEWQEMIKQYNFTCPMCYRSEPEIKLTEDHIIPLSKGGSNDIDNIQPLCLHCNLSKHDKLIPKFQLITTN